MESRRRSDFSSEIWDWVVERIPRIAARYPDLDADELSAELRVVLLELRHSPPRQVRDWRAYLVKSLLNRASRLARKWRQIRTLEATPLAEQEPAPSERQDNELRWIAQYRRLGNADRRFLKHLEVCQGNITRLSATLGQHRNTIHRRLRRLRRRMLLFEIESAGPTTGPPPPQERGQLERILRSPRSSRREVLRARVILDLMDGLTYQEILRRRRTSSSTIARWSERFGRHGIAGLKPNHPGRKSTSRTSRLHDRGPN